MPEVTYMLELTKQELGRLQVLLRLLDVPNRRISRASIGLVVGDLDPIERGVLEKVQRLMEGR